MVGEPCAPCSPRSTSRSAASDFRGDIGRARLVGDVPFNVFSRAISAARINLNVTRRAHATVYASSTSRPFELAMSGATIVSNPHDGIERWFEPGRELLVVERRRRGDRRVPRAARRPGAAPRRWAAPPASARSTSTPTLHRARRLLEPARSSAFRRPSVAEVATEAAAAHAATRG